MDGLTSNETPLPKLSMEETLELERIYQDIGEKTLNRSFCKEIATNFGSSSKKAGKAPAVSWEQVQKWFQKKHKESEDQVNSSTDALKLIVDLSDKSALSNGHKSLATPKGIQASDLSELAFESRSSKDLAWHDVAMFLNYRVLSTGELEVRVRYAGFGKDEDEWVNVREWVRERSIPLEPSECHKLKEGHLVLCFLERDDYALYCDARVLKIQRRQHDNTECRCIFTVRFYHDDSEEAVRWNRLCCRPTQDESVAPVVPLKPVILNHIENLWG